jgi:hypothetical protein
MLDACAIIGSGRSAAASRGGSGEFARRSGVGPPFI